MGAREFEFGVQFPGEVVPGDRWTRTGLRDPGVPFDAERIFGRRAPLVVDLGCGNGRYLIGSALARPGHDHLGIDVVQRVIDYAAHRANKRGLTNVRFVFADAVTWLHDRLAPDSADELHIYHPQPYYDPAEAGRRMLTPEFLDRAWKVLRTNGLLVLQTDNKSYWDYLLKAVPKHFDVTRVPGPWPDAPQGRSRREIIARQKGLAIFRMEARRRDALRAIVVPRPDFNADRPLFREKRKDTKPRGR